MKKATHYLYFFVFCLPCLGCTKKSSTHELSIILDNTEQYFLHFSMKEVRHMSTITQNLWNGERMKINCITELGYNDVRSFELESVKNLLLANEYNRRLDTANYYQEIDSTLTKYSQDKKTRNGSVIYKIMADELDRLSKSKADSKTMVVNSDLNENSFVSFYNPDTILFLRFNSEEMERTFFNRYPFGDLTNIDIYIVYQPQTVEDSERFEHVSKFYKSFFEKHNAKVFIKTSLN